MDIKTFKTMLDLHGADFSRWENIAPREAQDFMAESARAAALYKEAQELDQMLGMAEDHQPDPALLSRAMEKTEDREKPVRNKGQERRPENPLSAVLGRMFHPRFAPAFAAVIVMLALAGGFALQQGTNVSAPESSSAAQDVEQFMAQLEQQAAEAELLALLEMAANDVSSDEAEIEAFLDTLFEENPQAPPPAAEEQPDAEDLWDILFAEDTEQL